MNDLKWNELDKIFSRRGLEGVDQTLKMVRLFEVVENLDKEFPILLQKYSEQAKLLEERNKRIDELVQQVNEIQEKAVSEDGVRSIIKNFVLDELQPIKGD